MTQYDVRRYSVIDEETLKTEGPLFDRDAAGDSAMQLAMETGHSQLLVQLPHYAGAGGVELCRFMPDGTEVLLAA